MNTRKNIKGMLLLFAALFVVLCAYLVYIVNVYGDRWFTSPYNSRLNELKRTVIAGDIRDRTGTVLARADGDGGRVYSEDRTVRRATAHAVGDNFGQTLGAESTFAHHLLGYDQGLVERVTQAVAGQKNYGADIRLTIDADLSAAAYRAMGDYNGAVLLMNYKTGEVLANVSKPAFDPKYMEEYLGGEREMADGAMVNRATTGKYTPGSVFKIVTATAALRYLPGVTTRTFTCEGPLVFDADTGALLPHVHITPAEDAANRKQSEPGKSGEYLVVRDYNGEYHGELDLQTAFAKSCNHVFATLAVEIGAARLSTTAKDLGVGESFVFTDMVTGLSSFEQATDDVNTAWSGVGQYKDTMTPMNLCLITAAIANGGSVVEPKLLYDVTTKTGAQVFKTSARNYTTFFTKTEAETLQTYMEATVKSGTGRNARISGLMVGGKTGTAEVGGAEDKPNAWFTGYIADDAHPLAIVVVLEKGGSGGSNAAPVAAKIFKEAVSLGY